MNERITRRDLPVNMTHLDHLKFSIDDDGVENGSVIQLLRHGTWNHPKYGKIIVNDKTFDDIIHNFSENVRGVDIAIDTEHKADKGAKGWISHVFKEGNGLYAEVEWTPVGEDTIKNKEYRYISAEYSPIYTDTESGETHRNVLIGAALTNRPFIKDMEPVLLSETVQDDIMRDVEYQLTEDSGAEMPADDYDRSYEPNVMRFHDAHETNTQEYARYKSDLKDALIAEREKTASLERKIKLMEAEGEVDGLIRTTGTVAPRNRRKLTDLFARLPEDDASVIKEILQDGPRRIHLSEIGSSIAPEDERELSDAGSISLVEAKVRERAMQRGKSELSYQEYRNTLKSVLKNKTY